MAVKKPLARKKKRLTKPASKTVRKAVQPKSVPNNSVAKRRKRLQNSIAKIPPDRLSEVEDKINEILKPGAANEPKSLRGIWAGLGLENIDLEKEIRAARDAMQKQILDRHLRNELSS